MRSVSILRRLIGAAAAAAAVVSTAFLPSSANALPFQYAVGDIIGVFTKSGVDMIVDFGQLPTSGVTTKTYALPIQWSGSVAGGKFSAFRVGDEYAFPEVVELTTQQSLTFADPTGQFAAAISSAQQNIIPWVHNLPLIPDAPAGGNVFARDVNRVVVKADYGPSYSNVLGLQSDGLGEVLTNGVSTKGLFGAGETLSIPFYTTTFDFNGNGDSVYSATLRGTFGISGGQVSYSVIPEPGPLLLMASGLLGLALMGRSRRDA